MQTINIFILELHYQKIVTSTECNHKIHMTLNIMESIITTMVLIQIKYHHEISNDFKTALK